MSTPWEQAWHEALYGPAGFYRRHAPAAHFATSAQGIPGGTEILAAAVAALARQHGCTRTVDLACGRGELLHALAATAPDLQLLGVDVVDRPAGLPPHVGWLRSPGGTALPDDLHDLEATLVLAHEWLDVVPTPVLARHREAPDRWHELWVDHHGDEVWGPLAAAADLAWVRAWVGEQVQRIEVGRPRDEALADLVSRVRSGLVVAVDYGHTRENRPAWGTLTGFRDGREVDPVPDGSCDLTAHVAVDSLVAAAGGVRATTQAELLPTLTPAPRPPERLARTEPAAYLEAHRRRAALDALTARGGLGDFWWVLVPVPATT